MDVGMRFDAFDLVELTVPVAGHAPGDRGTVMIAGPGHALVDFAWSDHHRRSERDVVDVQNRSLRLIERRRDLQHAGPRS